VRFTPFPTEPVGWLIEQAGEELFLFSSDFPHPERTKDPLGRFEDSLTGVRDAARDRFYSRELSELVLHRRLILPDGEPCVTEVAGSGARTIRSVGLTFRTRQRRLRRPRTLIVLADVLALGAGALFAIRRQSSGPPALPSGQVDAFLRAWGAGDGRTMASLLDRAPTTDLAVLATTLVDTAPGSRAHYTRTSLVRDPHGDVATATYHGHIDVAGFGPFDWNGTLAIARVKLAKQALWRIMWQPSDLYPGLAAGRHLALQLSWPPRASITAMDGSLLAGPRSVVTIGLEPDRIATTLGHIKQLLHTLVGTDPATIDAALRGPGVRPNYFVPVATVPDDDRYRTVLRPRLAPVPGVFFQHSSSVLPTSDLLGAQLIGSRGDITAERLHQLGPPYRVGDNVGLSGLQAAYETRLAGRPTGTVVIEAGTKVVRTVKEFPGRAAQPVVGTIDPATQHAAESALAGVTLPAALPAALVAIDASTVHRLPRQPRLRGDRRRRRHRGSGRRAAAAKFLDALP
jgi:hypothetical protein